MAEPFLIGEALKFGWHKTKAHSGVLFQGMLALVGIQILTSIIEKVFAQTLEGYLASAVLSIVGVIVGTGFTIITLKLARGEAASYRNLIPEAAVVWRFFLASLVSGLIIFLGLLLLIIPGIYLALRFSMVRFAAIDGAGIRESLKKSSTMTHGIKWRLLLLFLALIGLNVLGALCLLVGLLVTVPMSSIAYAHVYQKLRHRHAHA